MRKIKESFKKVREDTAFLREEISNLKKEIKNLTEKVDKIGQGFSEENKTHPYLNKTDNVLFSTGIASFKPPKTQNLGISTGNRGVPTDKQTNRQTNRQTGFEEDSVKNALEILGSLDNIKKEIRLKFKRLTNREFLIFSVLYQLDEKNNGTNYKEISEKLKLSESSIRDYIGRIINKGIPVEKKKINNKIVLLSISGDLKKIATLSTILQLREI